MWIAQQPLRWKKVSRMNVRWPQLICMACAIAQAGCSEDSDHDRNANGGQAGASGATQSIACESTTSPQLEGTWAVLARYSLQLQSRQGGVVSMCPVDQVAPATLLFILDIQSSAQAALDVSAVPCQLELPNVSAMVGECRPEQSNGLNVTIPIPEPLTRGFATVPPTQIQGSISPSDALSFESLGFTWGTRSPSLPEWNASASGCGMSDLDIGRSETCEPSCVDACDALVDDDQDGFPGVTVHVCGTTEDDVRTQVPCHAEQPTIPGVTLQGMIRMALRTQLVLQGQALSSCEALGTFASQTEYAVVGADTYLTNVRVSVASARQSLPLFKGKTEDSRWRMIRVDGRHGAADWNLPQDAASRCSIVRSRRNELE